MLQSSILDPQSSASHFVRVPAFPRLDEYVGLWAIEPRAAMSLWDLARKIDFALHVQQPAPRSYSTLEKAPAARPGKSIAIIKATGLLMKQLPSATDGTSTIQLRRDIRQAAADPDVDGILLAIDSPGGTVSGTDDLAADIRAAAKRKPVWAQIEDLGASAAYWLAASAEKIFANSPTALVGSIGTILVLYDLAQMAANQGVKTLVFATGPLKGAGAEGTAISDEQQAYFQRIVDETQTTFDQWVRKGRGFTPKQLEAVKTGEVWTAPIAMDLGLIDGIQSLDQTLAALAKAAASSQKGKTMNTQESGVRNQESGIRSQESGFRSQESGDSVATDHGPRTTDHGQDNALDSNTVVASMREAAAAEAQRIAAVRASAAGHADIEAKAIKEGWDVLRTELEVLRASRPTGPAVHVKNDSSDGLAIEASLCLAAGLREERLAKQYGDKVMEAARSKRYQRMSIIGAMHETIAAAGMHVRPGRRVTDDFIRTAFDADKKLRAEGFTTLSLSGILGNTANKALLDSYDSVEAVWPFIAAVRNHGDFKVHTRYRLDSTGAFKKVGRDGELKSVGLDEASFTSQLDTFGAIVSLTRQDITNDDLDAFLQLPMLLGRMAKLRVEEAVFVLLLSNPGSFFAAGNGNLLTGAGSVLAIAGLNDAERNFRNMVDSNGKPILVTPSIILVPTTLSVTANQLYTDTFLVGSTTADALKPSGNPHRGKYRPATTPYLNNTAITDESGAALSGQSATAWYLFADPRVRAAVGVAFLDGQQVPTVESAETDFQTLGMKWRSYLDFGVGMEDPKAAVKSAGA